MQLRYALSHSGHKLNVNPEILSSHFATHLHTKKVNATVTHLQDIRYATEKTIYCEI